jgi:hypothetical protein
MGVVGNAANLIGVSTADAAANQGWKISRHIGKYQNIENIMIF